MAFTNFDYFLTPYDDGSLIQGGYNMAVSTYYKMIKTFGTNGEPQELTEEPGKFIRSYKHQIKSNSRDNSIVDYSSAMMVVEKNYLKNDLLFQNNLIDNNGTFNRNKNISVRMKLKISENVGDFSITDDTLEHQYYRYFAGITIFGEESPSILDYQTDEQGTNYNVEKFSYNGGVPVPNNFPEYTDMNVLSGYNLILSSDGRGVRGANYSNWEYRSWSDPRVSPPSRHLSLYSYGTDTPLINVFANSTVENGSFGGNSDRFKLYECNTLSGQQEYLRNVWYNIRLDLIPITSTSHKLISYAAIDGDLTWTKVGEVVHSESDGKYLNKGRIGFVVSTITSGLGNNNSYRKTGFYDEDFQQGFTLYELDTETSIESFEVYSEDIEI